MIAPKQPGDDRRLAAVRKALAMIRDQVDMPLNVRLWDGSVEPLGANAGEMTVRIETPGVLPSLLRRPTLAALCVAGLQRWPALAAPVLRKVHGS